MRKISEVTYKGSQGRQLCLAQQQLSHQKQDMEKAKEELRKTSLIIKPGKGKWKISPSFFVNCNQTTGDKPVKTFHFFVVSKAKETKQ